MNLAEHGCSLIQTHIPQELPKALLDNLFHDETAGERCLLDHPSVRQTALALKHELSAIGHLSSNAVAIQAIAFNKSPTTNWKVAWHQDLMFPFEKRVSSDGFLLPTLKQGIHHARPPEAVLKQLLAVRLHLDDCGTTNGPLRISPGTHLHGILKSTEIQEQVTNQGEITCLAKNGELLLMRPLVLHASSQASEPKHRRILHLVYHSGEAIPETWHRAI